jgi:ribosomal protein L2
MVLAFEFGNCRHATFLCPRMFALRRVLTTPGLRQFSSSSRLFASHGSTLPPSFSSSSEPSSSTAQPPAQSSQFKTYKPITPSIRHLRRPISSHLYEGRPVRELTIPQRKKGGRNAHGRITVRWRGGGHKRRLRNVDFMRMEPGLQDVIRIEFDPGRSAHIALVKHRNPSAALSYAYILACEGLRAGDVVQSFRQGIPDGLVPGYVDSDYLKRRRESSAQANASLSPSPLDPSAPQSVLPLELVEEKASSTSEAAEAATRNLSLGVLRAITIKPGNVLPLRLIPTGTQVHSISLRPTGRGILVRSAGSFGQIVAHDDEGKWTQVRLQSGEVRNILQTCCATIGKVSNADWKNRSLGKAGRSRWLGRRPSVRGMAMNA